MTARKRYLLMFFLVPLSAVPQAIVMPVLGDENLAFLLLLWVLLGLWCKAASWRWSVAFAVLCAVAMAIPPSPNYFSVSSGEPRFFFVGLGNIRDGLYGAVFFFVFYLAIFWSVAALLSSRRAEKK